VQPVSFDELAALLGRGMAPSSDSRRMAGRTLLFHRNAPFGSLTVFQGSHEMPSELCFARLKSLVRGEAPPEDYKAGQ
jgi:hypothetical protein